MGIIGEYKMGIIGEYKMGIIGEYRMGIIECRTTLRIEKLGQKAFSNHRNTRIPPSWSISPISRQ